MNNSCQDKSFHPNFLESQALEIIFNAEQNSQEKQSALQNLFDQGLEIDAILPNQKSILFCATSNLDKDLVKFLLQKNANVWTVDSENNPLLLAKNNFSQAGFTEIGFGNAAVACDILNMLMNCAIYAQNPSSKEEFLNFARSNTQFFYFYPEKHNLIELMYPENLAAIAENFSESSHLVSHCIDLMNYKMENGITIQPEVIERIENVMKSQPSSIFRAESVSSLLLLGKDQPTFQK